MQQHQVETKPQQRWEPITAPLIFQSALKQRGKAGSADGWSGSEVGLWPFEVWECITPFFQLLENLGAFPIVFGRKFVKHICQSKDGSVNGTVLPQCLNFVRWQF